MQECGIAAASCFHGILLEREGMLMKVDERGMDKRRTNKKGNIGRRRRRYSYTFFASLIILFGVTWLWKNIDTILAQQYSAGSGSFSAAFAADGEMGVGESAGKEAVPAWLTEKYPASLRELYKNNPETEEFVKSYFKEKDKRHKIDLSGEVSGGMVPIFLQWDKRWGYEQYGSDMMALTGCGPTCLSMVICGLTGDSSQTPYAVAKQAESAGYYVEGSGSSWTLMSEGAGLFGLRSWEFAFDEQHIRQELRDGHPIICAMRAGDFTTTGHFIVLCGEDEDGRIVVHDPNSRKRSEKRWELTTLMGQTRAAWAFSSTSFH